ncbi:MAG TPA: hypothetical protein VHG51_19670, partial [Longimicrobiaceae bacterium]|nr:hypothetical protein [Longimicrobiaceae bacterium]
MRQPVRAAPSPHLPPMRSLRFLLALLALALALPQGAQADTGWSAELSGRRSAAAPVRTETLAPAPRTGPGAVHGFPGGESRVLAERGGRGARGPGVHARRDTRPPDPAAP